MTHEDAGHYAKKHPHGTRVPEEWFHAVREAGSDDGTITCAAAHRVAGDLAVDPPQIGVAIDLLEFRIKKCQLGLYGYAPEKKIVTAAETVDPAIRSAIEKRSVEGRISCRDCWDAAAELSIPKMAVSSVCESLGVRIKPCQLGAF